MTKTAIIIGAGYAGMALANLLGKAGYKVRVYEKNSAAGGRIYATKQDGFTFDLGPSWYLMPEVFEQYYQLFDQSAKKRLELIRFSPGYKVFYENHPSVEIIGDVEQDKQTFESIEKGSAKKLQSYVDQSTKTYQVSVRHFLYNNFQKLSDVITKPVIFNGLKMLQLVSQTLDGYVKKSFHDIRLKQLLEYHMVFLGSSPFEAPAIYSLMSHLDFRSGVYYPKRGMLSLVDDMQAIGESLDIEYFYDSPIKKIMTAHAKATGVELTDGSIVEADVVISNADLQHTETNLLDKSQQSFPSQYWQKRQPGPGALLISLGIKGSLPSLLHHNLYFVEDWRENFTSIYVDNKIPKNTSIYICNPTKTDPELAPAGHENIFMLMPLPAGITLGQTEQAKLVERAVSILADVSGQPDIGSRIVSRHVFSPEGFADRFNAWQYNAFGGESHILRQSVIFRTKNQSRKVKNLFYVGAGTLPGIGLPMCLISAELVFKKITGNRSAGPLNKDDI